MGALSLVGKIYGDAAVIAEPGLCLHARSRGAECQACYQACPVPRALSPGPAGPELDPLVCKGCGLCEPACPTGVFTLKETAALLPRLGDGPVAALACARHGESDASVKVSCPGGLAPETLAAAALGRTLLLIVPESCARCWAGVPERLAEQVTAAARVLAAFGQSGQIRVAHSQAELQAEVATANQLGRRQFLDLGLKGLMAAVTAAVRPQADQAEPRPVPAQVPSRRRIFLASLRSRAGRLPESAPAGGTSFASVAAGSGCDGCEACVRSCPGGAISLARLDGADALQFRADACLACGLCVTACPQRLLTLEEQFSPAVVAAGEVRALAALPTSNCRSCSRPFHGFGDRCPECRKRDWLVSQLSGLK